MLSNLLHTMRRRSEDTQTWALSSGVGARKDGSRGFRCHSAAAGVNGVGLLTRFLLTPSSGSDGDVVPPAGSVPLPAASLHLPEKRPVLPTGDPSNSDDAIVVVSGFITKRSTGVDAAHQEFY